MLGNIKCLLRLILLNLLLNELMVGERTRLDGSEFQTDTIRLFRK